MKYGKRHIAALPHSIYLIEGPTGVYVGCTCKTLHQRWQMHVSEVVQRSSKPLYVAIREHGEFAFAMFVVAQSRTKADGLATEKALIAQLLSEGRTLYNCTLFDSSGRGFYRRHTQTVSHLTTESAVAS